MADLAVDTWAFVEVATNAPRARDVEQAFARADFVFTVRDVVVETFNFLLRESGGLEEPWAWWGSLEAGRLRIYEPALREVAEFVGERPLRGSLSFTDHALAYVALRERCKDVATGDAEFRRLGLNPLFARRR